MSRVWQRLSELTHLSPGMAVNPNGTGTDAETPAATDDDWSEENTEVKETRFSIANQFSAFPGGADSAHDLLKVLIPILQANDRVVLDLDGVAAVPASFLKHLFHTLVAEGIVPPNELSERLKVNTSDPELKIYESIAEKYVREEAELAAA